MLVFDVGGTHLRCGVYDPTRDALLRSARLPTPSYRRYPELSPQRLRTRLYSAMKDIADRLDLRQPKYVSVAFAGPVDREGTVLHAPTIWGGNAVREPVAERLADLWPTARSIRVVNDVSAAGYSFMRTKNEDFCLVTVSSGIGHKVFIDGRPIVGPRGYGGEIGHLRIDFSEDAPRCDCGGMGHLAAFASGRASAYHVAQLIKGDPRAFEESIAGTPETGTLTTIDNTRIASAFRAGERWAEYVICAMAVPLGRVLAGIHLAVGIERFVLMGGFATALGSRYLDLVAESALQADWQEKLCWRRMLELGEVGDNAGLLGAGRVASRVPSLHFGESGA